MPAYMAGFVPAQMSPQSVGKKPGFSATPYIKNTTHYCLRNAHSL